MTNRTLHVLSCKAPTWVASAMLIAFTATVVGLPLRAMCQTDDSSTLAQQARAYEQATERIRDDCIQGRRMICGRILKILPDGLVVDSGYTNLMRLPLEKSWLAPGTVQASRPANLVEGNEPGCVCVGPVFLTALPKMRRATKPKPYDYVVIQAYPAGHFTYTSVGTIQRTVRRFAAALPAAVVINRDDAGIKPPMIPPAPAPAGK